MGVSEKRKKNHFGVEHPFNICVRSEARASDERTQKS